MVGIAISIIMADKVQSIQFSISHMGVSIDEKGWRLYFPYNGCVSLLRKEGT